MGVKSPHIHPTPRPAVRLFCIPLERGRIITVFILSQRDLDHIMKIFAHKSATQSQFNLVSGIAKHPGYTGKD